MGLVYGAPMGHAAPTQAPSDEGRPPLALRLAFGMCLLALTVLARFGIGVSADFSISFGMVGSYALVAALLWTGMVRINTTATLLVVAVMVVASLSLLVNQNYAPWRRSVSLNSWALLVMLYLPFALMLCRQSGTEAMWRWLLRAYLNLALFVAVLGIAQYFLQFVFRPAWLIDYTPLIPEAIRGSGQYNTSNTTGSAFKSNGFFLREPSTFSFYTAFALILEWSLFRRKWALAVLAMGLLVSYSGSGILILMVAMMLPLGFKTLLRAGAAALVVATLYFTAGEALNLTYTFKRVDEFGSDRSSAYCRFILPAKTVVESIDSQPWVSLIGHGPGTMQKITSSCETTFGKVFFEYGLLGGLAFTALMLHALSRSWVPLRARAALLVFWYVLGGQLLGPDALLTIFLLCAVWPPPQAPPAPGRLKGVPYG